MAEIENLTISEPIEIRCPFRTLQKSKNKLITCNRLCVKVYPGSSGEAYCNNCNLHFDFEVARNSVHADRIIRVKK